MIPTLGHIMSEAVSRFPDRLALVELAEGAAVETQSRLTYRELDDVLNRVAVGALDTGLRPGDCVGIALRNRVEFVTTVFGLMRAGIVPALINPRLSEADLAFMLEDIDAKAVIGDEVSGAALKAAAEQKGVALCYGAGTVEGFAPLADLMAAPGAQPPEFIVGPDATALLIFTSGSTGRPKGVVITHRGQIESFQAQRRFYDAIYTRPSVNLIATPLFHKNGTGNLKTTFITGGTVILMPRFDAEAMLNAIVTYGVTTFTAVATMLHMMMRHEARIRDTDFSLVDSIMVGAAPTGRVLLDRVEDAFKSRVFHMYGTSECGAVFGHDPERRYTLDSCGRPLPGVEVKLIDVSGDEADEGEVWVRSLAMAAGYHKRDDITAERFTDGWYKTGDILKRDAQGYFFFRGRIDDMFVCGGENIYPLEVERILLLHPQIQSACVVPVPHPTKGSAPAAAIITDDSELTEERVKAWFLDRGPAYAHPRFVQLEKDLPIAATGKIDRRAVQARLSELAPAMFAEHVSS